MVTARVLVWVQSPLLLLLALSAFQQDEPVVGVLALAGTAVLAWGGVWIGRDAPPAPPPHVTGDLRRVPWDWSDVLIFIAALFAAASALESIARSIVDAFTVNVDSTVRTAAESFAEQAAFYAGGLFNIWLLGSLRRGATLFDLGWRRVDWYWLPAAVGVAAVTYWVAGVLQEYSQRLFPSAQNGQCIAVQHDYSHFLVLAIIVVCVMAPLAEETMFRGFIYGWARRAMPLAAAVAVNGVIFATLHFQLLLLIPLFAVGVILALVYQFSRSLIPGALVHALFNLPGIIFILSSPSC